ncbi:hypothetical protein NESM_000026000 [Novymonas esmeraldas]|uniref:Transcription factor CBF/NF-Y/archaeal histone domain-containing protein n=1 Tax=Novymonas esmeraldas TaxID=1808958 RepID=A0AAW0F2F5_9TRYP
MEDVHVERGSACATASPNEGYAAPSPSSDFTGCADVQETSVEPDAALTRTRVGGDDGNTASTAPVGSAGASVKARSLAAGQVNRLVDGALPAGMSVSRDARIALQKCATVALFYLACLADAERKAAGSSRTTLNVQDIRGAMEAAGLAHLVPLLSTAAKRGRD